MQERVYNQLRKSFLNSRFLPGQTLTLRGLAELTGTSVQPVREALQRLCAEGALVWLPNTAFRVPEIDPARYRELWQIRMLLEGYSTSLAASRIPADSLAQLAQINREMREAMRRSDGETVLRLNRDFHFAIYGASNSPVLVSLIEMIWMQISPLFAAFTQRELSHAQADAPRKTPAAAAEDFFQLQDEIMEALAAHKPDQAESALRRELELSATLFSRSLGDIAPKVDASKSRPRRHR
ncbi:MAG TPA: GntR family transcriptional regulator [Steroidobacteraceae bacterium]|nr:GntR family transcriptional regulator [Steroidobacteraceae bacterium]